MRAIGRVQGQRHHNARVTLTGNKPQTLYSIGQCWLCYAYPILHIKGGYIYIGTNFKIYINAALPATGTVAAHVSHARRTIYLRLNSGGGCLLHRLCICSRKATGDRNYGWRNIRVLRNRQNAQRY